jgi:hypothetical protein
MTTFCVYRFIGSVPPPGFPLLVDDDTVPGETPPLVMGQRIRKRVSHIRQHVLEDDETSRELKEKLEEGFTLRELHAWAEKDVENEADKKKLTKAISVAKKLNDKSLLRSVLLPCEKVLFLGLVAESQPPPPQGAVHGLNHVNLVVEGPVGPIPAMFTKSGAPTHEIPNSGFRPKKEDYYDSDVLDGYITVLGEPVGTIINGQRILMKSGIRLSMPAH